MSALARMEQHSPLPLMSLSSEHQYDLHYLLQHNSAAQYQPHPHNLIDEYTYFSQVPGCSSPISGQVSMDQDEQGNYQRACLDPHNIELDIHNVSAYETYL